MNFSDHIVRQIQLVALVVGLTLANACPSFGQGQEETQPEIEVRQFRKTQYLLNNKVIGEVIEDANKESEDEIDRSLISNYWIGIQCEKAGSSTFSPKAAPEAELTIKGGLKILTVTQESAANEAGLKENDVLLKFANKDVNSLNELYAVIGETKDNESELVLIREGKLVSLKITPQKRPETSQESVGGQSGVNWQSFMSDPSIETFSFYNGPSTSKQHEGAYPIQMGTTLFQVSKQVPEGYRIKVELAPGEDIALTVEQGDDTFKANGDSVDQLPKAVQDIANELVAKCKPMIESKQDSKLLPLLTIDTSRLPELKGYQRTEAHINEKLAAIEKQLTEITKVTKVLQEELTKAPQELKSDLKN